MARGRANPLLFVFLTGALAVAALAVHLILGGTESAPVAQTAEASGTPAPPATTPEVETRRVEVSETVVNPDPLQAISLAEARQQALLGQVVVYGKVFGPDREPVPRAQIWFDGQLLTHSDEEGRYRLATALEAIANTNERPRYPIIAAFKKELGSDFRESPCRSRRIDFELATRSTVSGTVFEARSNLAVPDTVVTLHSLPQVVGLPRRKTLHWEVEADGRGRFRFEGVPLGRVALRAVADGYGMSQWRQFEVSDASFSNIELRMSPTQKVRGKFRPWPPEGIEDVTAIHLQVHSAGDRLIQQSLDGEGHFEFELHGPLTKIAAALHAGDGILWQDEISLGFRPRLTDVGTIQLPRTGALRGRVEGVRGLAPLGLALRALCIAGGQPVHRDHPLRADGSFETGPLPPCTVSIGLFAGELLLGHLGMHPVQPGEVEDLGALQLKERILAGQVRTRSGNPVPGCTVHLEVKTAGRKVATELSYASADAEGRFVLKPRRTPWDEKYVSRHLFVRCGDRRAPVLVDLGPEPALPLAYDVVLPEPRVSTGKLLDQNGQPLSGWAVKFHRAQNPRFPRAPRQNRDVRVDVTATDGSFELLDLDPEGRYRVQVTGPNNQLFLLDERGGDQDLLISLPAAPSTGN